MPTAQQNFPGVNFETSQAGWPPDPNGDVGPNEYVQAVNINIGIYSKTGTQLASFPFDGFFTGTGTACDNMNQGDPIVLYDSLANRWLISDFAWPSTSALVGPFYECIAISKTGDPIAGGWWFYGLETDPAYMSDYPKLGVWPDAYYMSANMFDVASSGQPYLGAKVWAFNRNAMLNGQPTSAVSFAIPCLTACYFTLLPSNLKGTPPPAGSPDYYVSASAKPAGGSALYLWKFHVDWTNTAKSTFIGPATVDVTPYTYPGVDVIPQPHNYEFLDALGDRLMMQLQYRNINGVESLWVNHTVMSGAETGIRWYEIRNPGGTPTVYQQGTYDPGDGNYRWLGSVAVDRRGNMALGFSRSSTSQYPSIAYAGRLSTDPLNVLTQGETTLVQGTGAQNLPSRATGRWGDYSAMSVDPNDDCTFWYTNEYYSTTGQDWQTEIGSFAFPSCTTGNAQTAHFLYLPSVANGSSVASAPDLTVESIRPTGNNLLITIKNQGTAPVTSDFWVDAYINPNPVPTKTNQIWKLLASQGLVWGVTAPAIPLAPGHAILLEVGYEYYRPELSHIDGPLPVGTRVYVQADSADALTNYGAILEQDELGGTYNNIAWIQLGAIVTFSTGEIVPQADSSPKANLAPR